MRAQLRHAVLSLICIVGAAATAIAQCPGAPAIIENFGTFVPVGLGTTVSRTPTLAANQIVWYKFTLSTSVRYQDGTYLDINTDGVNTDSEVALFNCAGQLMGTSDDEGPGLQAALSFGHGEGSWPGGSIATTNTINNGRNLDLPAGHYYIAVSKFNTQYASSGFSATSSAPAGPVALNIRYGAAAAAIPLSFVNLGTLAQGGTVIRNLEFLSLGNRVQFYRITLPEASNSLCTYLDMDTEGTTLSPSSATSLALYTHAGALVSFKTTAVTLPSAGVRVYDTIDGSNSLSQLTFGQTTPVRPAVGNGTAYNGRDGDLRPGTYYIAVSNPGVAPSIGGTSAIGLGISSTSTNYGLIRLTLRSGSGSTNPVGSGTLTPNSVSNCGSSTTRLCVAVTPGCAPVSSGITVTSNLTALGLGNATLFDDGTNGDVVAGDNIFCTTITIPASLPPGVYAVPFTVTDAQVRASTGTSPLTITACPSGTFCTFTGCTSLFSASGSTVTPGQVVTFVLRGGVNPVATPCPWYGIGAVRGTISTAGGASSLPVTVIGNKANIGYGNSTIGSVGTTAAGALAINGIDCSRAPRLGGPGPIYGGCPLNNSAQDVYRFDFTVPAGAIPGTVYTFCFSGSVYGINTWSTVAGVSTPVLSAPIAVSPTCATVLVTGPAPNNNACTNCTQLIPGVTTTGTTASATTDGSSSCGGTNDVWYCYTPTCPQPITVNTCGGPAATDTILSVHTACPGASGNQIACNDDALPGTICPGTLQSSTTFTPTPGLTYFFRVATLGTTGVFNIRLTQPTPTAPSNDECATATTASSGATLFNTCGATTSAASGCPMHNDIWYTYTATASGNLSISLCGSAMNTVLGVYSGGCSNLCFLTCNDDAGPICAGTASSVTLATAAGQMYRIRIGAPTTGSTGTGVLNITTTPAAAPPNDSCLTATAITLGSYTGTTIGASPSATGLTGLCGASDNSPDVYYSFSTCSTAPVTIDTCGLPACTFSPLNTVISVHTACPSSSGLVVASCNDDALTGPCANTQNSILTFTPSPCTPYYIRVAGSGVTSGNFALNVSQPTTGPANDSCSAAIPYTVGPVTYSTCNATTDGDAISCSAIANDVWYTWSAPCAGTATVDTCGSSFDTVLAVYQSSACPPPASSLVLNGCKNNTFESACGPLNSRITVPVTPGANYLVRIGGSGGATGCGRLNITVAPPACPPVNSSAEPLCAPVLYFQIDGTSTGNAWKWRLSQDCCFSVENCNAPAFLPAGSSATDIAATFAQSLNDSCPPVQIEDPPGSGNFVDVYRIRATDVSVNGVGAVQVKTTCCPNPTNPLLPRLPTILEVGTLNDQCDQLCTVVTGSIIAASGGTGLCNFNPFIYQLETSGVDCNNNTIDDMVDIALGSSPDTNSDGIPDECQSGLICDAIDFNNDSLFPDTGDIDDFLSVFGGGPCSNDPNCGDIDFNNDGLFPDTSDIDSFLSVFSGGLCL
jgi:hypothetical protein